MSMSLTITYSDGREDEVRLGSPRSFEKYVTPGAVELGLELLPYCYQWMRVTPENLSVLIDELSAYCADLARRSPGGNDTHEPFERMILLLGGLEDLEGWDAQIG